MSKSVKTIIIFFACVFLLSGCREQGTLPPVVQEDAEITTEPQSTPSSIISPESLPENSCKAILLDGSIPIGKNTRHIPNEALESLEHPDLIGFGGNILAVGMSFVGSSDAVLSMKVISPFDGSLRAETYMDCSGFPYVQSDGERVSVCDAGLGMIHILDNHLEILMSYERTPSGEFWCLNSDLTKLFVLSWQNGIYSVELQTGKVQSVFQNVSDFMVRTCTDDYIAFSCVDRTTQKNFNGLLELNTGDIVSSPVAGEWSNMYRHGESTWLLSGVSYVDDCILFDNGRSKLIPSEESRMELLGPCGHLIRETSTGSVISLYDSDGSFISVCDRSEADGRYVGESFLWSDLYGGYFFMDYHLSRFGRLVFWDINEPVYGEPLELLIPEPDVKGGQTAEPALYRRAHELSEQFDVEIRIADQCLLDYPHFNAYAVQDEGFITAALDVLENTLAVYPEGFFAQLQYAGIQTVRFELIGGLSAKEHTSSENYTGSYTAYAQAEADHYLVVMDVYMMSERTLYHEIAHIIDARLAWDARLRPQALFSEEEWLSLQPEGFEYARTYGEMPWEVAKYAGSGYFVRDYSCRYPTEDRATMMEAAMTGDDLTFEINPYLCDKLNYYSLCIRDCFETDGWPQVTAWEGVLQ